MKTTKMTINKTAEKPEGLTVNIVQPESVLEQDLMCYMLRSHLQHAKSQKSLSLELPTGFSVQYVKDGQFAMMSGPTSSGSAASPYYDSGRALAVLVILQSGNRFEIAHAALKPGAQARA